MAIGYLDLLGVSNKLLHEDIHSTLRMYEQRHLAIAVSKAWFGAGEQVDSQRVDSFVFSDSLVFTSRIENLALVTAVTASTFELLLNHHKTPSRGVIVTGEMCVNKETNFLLGKPLVQAASIEQCLNAPCLTVLLPEQDENTFNELAKYDWISDQSVLFKKGSKEVLAKKSINTDLIHLVKYYCLEDDRHSILSKSILIYEELSETCNSRVQELMANGVDLCRNEVLTLCK